MSHVSRYSIVAFFPFFCRNCCGTLLFGKLCCFKDFGNAINSKIFDGNCKKKVRVPIPAKRFSQHYSSSSVYNCVWILSASVNSIGNFHFWLSFFTQKVFTHFLTFPSKIHCGQNFCRRVYLYPQLKSKCSYAVFLLHWLFHWLSSTIGAENYFYFEICFWKTTASLKCYSCHHSTLNVLEIY